MIQLKRLPEPEHLKDNRLKWTEKFLESGNKRPPSRQYGHPKIREVLRAIGHSKCFYCEGKLSESEQTVDHFVEVSEDRTLAFDWDNLYLCCDGCQNKILSISRQEALDPCGTEDPSEHLFFDDEVIRPRDGSIRGCQTIDRYQLDRDDLESKRGKQLKRFLKHIIRILRANGGKLSQDGAESLRAFAQANHAYSLMFRQVLKDAEL